jgi:hypothetical protein
LTKLERALQRRQRSVRPISLQIWVTIRSTGRTPRLSGNRCLPI